MALVDDFDDPWISTILALAVPVTLQSSQLLTLLDLDARLPPAGVPWRCVTYDPRGEIFIDPAVIPIPDGSSLMVSIERPPPSALDLDFLPEGHLELLQLGIRRVRQQFHWTEFLDSTDASEPPCVLHLLPHLEDVPTSFVSKVDCTCAFEALALLDHLFLVPSFDIFELLGWHPASDWLLDWWDGYTAFDELAVYFDGSFAPTPQPCAGFGVSAFVRIGACWKFAGFIAAPLSGSADSYLAEQAAGLTATKLVYDLLCVRAASSTAPVKVTFRFDSLTIGQQAQGRWTSVRSPTSGKLLRGLVRLCETKFPCETCFEHIRTHWRTRE